MMCLRWSFVAVGLVSLACVRWKYRLLIQAHGFEHGGRSSFLTWVVAMDFVSYLFTVVMLLSPWWRLGDVISALGYAIVLPSCTYFLVGLSIVDLVYVHEQTLFHLFLLSGVGAQVFWLFLSLRAESRRATIAHLWKQRLRESHRGQIELAERFIREIEGEDRDVTRWSKFADICAKDDPMGMWKRMDLEWKAWANRGEAWDARR
jgi:hypothetical protein